MLNKRLSKMKINKIAICSHGLSSIPLTSKNKPIEVIVVGAGEGVGSVGVHVASKASEIQLLYLENHADLVQPYFGEPVVFEKYVPKSPNSILLKKKLDLISFPSGDYNPNQHKKLGKGGKAQKRSPKNNKFHK